jgi:hypothetical protein
MSKEHAIKIARAIERTRPSSSERRVAYQEAIHSANRKGLVSNNEGEALLWLLDAVSRRRRPKRVRYRAKKRRYGRAR